MNKLGFFLTIAMANVQAMQVQALDTFLAINPTINQIRTGLIEHKFSCEQLINGYLDRIRLYNLTTTNNLAPLNAITQINPQALAEAKKLDVELTAAKTPVGPLFCIPVIVKDNFDVQGLRSSSGSLSLLGTYPVKDAEIVKNIKHQGGIILAKSAMDELACGLSGMSSLSGRTGNAYDSIYNPGGSSGGSAVSVAAGFAPLAIGSDNSGSVRIPAAYNGVYALRPTYGVVNNTGIFPVGNLDGTAGPMANNVRDLARLFTVMADSKIDYAQNLNANNLSGKHFAIIRSVAHKSLWDEMSKPITAIYAQVESNLHRQGVVITEVDLPDFNLEREYNMAGSIEEVNDYLASNISSISQFKQVCQGNSRVYGEVNHCLKLISGTKAKNSPKYHQVVQMIAKNQIYISNIMQQQHLDGLILPSGKDGVPSYDYKHMGTQYEIASNSGMPEITLPIAQSNGLPVGLEILGLKNSESLLLNYAYAYQEHYYAFKAPVLHPDSQFDNWSIGELNNLYLLIGKISFDTLIKPANQNKISPQQSVTVTKKSITAFRRF